MPPPYAAKAHRLALSVAVILAIAAVVRKGGGGGAVKHGNMRLRLFASREGKVFLSFPFLACR